MKWEEPIDLHDHRVRRLFAQELVTELRRVGAATIDEMREANTALLRIPAEKDELRQVSEVARRMGWVELRDRPTRAKQKEWAVSDLGLAIKRPASLSVAQVISRLLRFAEPVRTGVTAWLPIGAIVAGGIAAPQDSGNEAALATRIASIAVLAVTLVIGAVGEVYLVKAMQAFKRVQRIPFYAPARRFHSWPRLASVAAIDVLILVAFSLALFLVWPGVLVPLIPLPAIIAVNLLVWRIPADAVWRKRPPP